MTTPQSNAATKEQLWELHALLLDALLDYFRTTPATKVRAAMLEVARAFLRDNNVTLESAGAQYIRGSLEQMRALSLPFGPKTALSARVSVGVPHDGEADAGDNNEEPDDGT